MFGTKARSGLQDGHATDAWLFEAVILDKYSMVDVEYRCVVIPITRDCERRPGVRCA